ncbi:hypothetical protein Hamer_G014198 [Homarus americanus]|uniref:Uncharacterized protein n=1 Tax=Homarus americanus TaxID=6706 RepID=A0A8J5MS61_HOMAM|nr:hypothetical protein Hamer_G014198 [Homarus americanus]
MPDVVMRTGEVKMLLSDKQVMSYKGLNTEKLVIKISVTSLDEDYSAMKAVFLLAVISAAVASRSYGGYGRRYGGRGYGFGGGGGGGGVVVAVAATATTALAWALARCQHRDSDENYYISQIISQQLSRVHWTGGFRNGYHFNWPSRNPFSGLNWSQTGGNGYPQPDNREDGRSSVWLCSTSTKTASWQCRLPP